MYGIAQIQEEMYFWSKTINQTLENDKMHITEKNNVIIAFQTKLIEIETKIRSDINEYYGREQKLGWLFKNFRKRKIIRKIAELEECLGEVKRKQEELRNYQS